MIQKSGMAATFASRKFVTASSMAEGSAAKPNQRPNSVQVGASPAASSVPFRAVRSPERKRQAVAEQRTTNRMYPTDQVQTWVCNASVGSTNSGYERSASIEPKLDSAKS